MVPFKTVKKGPPKTHVSLCVSHITMSLLSLETGRCPLLRDTETEFWIREQLKTITKYELLSLYVREHLTIIVLDHIETNISDV